MEGLELVWGWQPAAYLFLGGLGAGAFATAAVLFLRNREEARRALNLSMWAALVCLGVGLLFLVTELVHPLRGMLLWQSFSHFTSWMTFGAWIAFSAMVVFAVAALLTCPWLDRWFAARRAGGKDAAKPPAEGAAKGETEDAAAAPLPYQGKAATVLVVVGLVLALGVAAYTGMLLMSAPGVPLWNSLFLPCLFTVSALDTGVALVELIALATGEPREEASERLLQKFVVALVVLESLALAAFMGAALSGAGASGAASATAALSLTQGVFAPWFWVVFVLLGLVFPLVAALVGLARRGKPGHGVTAVGATGALIGGCALRFLIVYAGMHADYVAQTLSALGL